MSNISFIEISREIRGRDFWIKVVYNISGQQVPADIAITVRGLSHEAIDLAIQTRGQYEAEIIEALQNAQSFLNGN